MQSAGQSALPVGASGNDPLAELARLIGQNDPFAEYGRETARRAAQQPAAPALAAHQDDYAAPEAYSPQHYQQAETFQPRAQVPGYPPDDAGYEHEAEYQTNTHSGAEDHDFYDDVPPRRRMGILAIAAVFALAVIGTAGAFGYRAIFGSSAASGPPPVIKAETAPTKIVPAANSKDPKTGKLIYDRVAERGQDEKLVSREEQPVVMNAPTGAAPQDQAAGSIQPPMGSSVVATEPKKVHTIAIRPDGTTMADPAPTPVVAPPPSPAPAPASAAAPAAQRVQAPDPAPRQPVARAELAPPPPPHRVVASAPSNAPLSLSPDAPEQAAPAPRVTRTAVAALPAQIAPAPSAPRAAPASTPASSGGSGYAVQISSQRSEADAQAAFRGLQAKFPGQLGGKQPMIRQVDLGAKGIYYRAMVGPLGSDEASQLCSNLKAAGGQCIVQRI